MAKDKYTFTLETISNLNYITSQVIAHSCDLLYIIYAGVQSNISSILELLIRNQCQKM